jgi:hypothetical protein
MAQMRFTTKEIRTYQAAQAIGELVHSQAQPGGLTDGLFIDDQRSYGVRYSGNQTTRGLYILIGEGGMLISTITPWGDYAIAGSWGGSTQKMQAAVRAIMAGMKTQKDEAARKALKIKSYWVHAVHSVGGITLPPPQLRREEQLIPTAQAMRQWAALGRTVNTRSH